MELFVIIITDILAKEDVTWVIRVLQYFLNVAREESITRVAETLNMTHPPLSRQLKDLEEELGKQLLIRGSKKVTLTEDGMLLRKRAEEMIDLINIPKVNLYNNFYCIISYLFCFCITLYIILKIFNIIR